MNLPTPDTETTLLPWLLAALAPMSRTRVKEWLHAGRVVVNGATTTRFDHPLRPGDRIAISRERLVPTVPILHEDDALIAIDKPAGLLAVATENEKQDTAFARLAEHLAVRRAGRPFVVHRIDRETSGLLLFARTAEARDRLQDQWPAVVKTYRAVTCGSPRPAEGTIENHLLEGNSLRVRVVHPERPGSRHAVSRYRTVESHGGLALVEVVLETGRKHQIRVHLTGLGCPVIGDDVYGTKGGPAGRLGLHAWRLALDHPVTGQRLELEAPFPPHLARLMGR